MKTNKLFFFFAFLFLITSFSCNKDTDSFDYDRGVVRVKIEADEEILFNLLKKVDLEISYFMFLYYESTLDLNDPANRKLFNEVNNKVNYMSLRLYDSHCLITFLNEIRNEESQQHWKMLKEELKLYIGEDQWSFNFNVPFGTEKEWVDRLNEMPEVISAGYFMECGTKG